VLGSAESEMVRLISGKIIFAKFQPKLYFDIFTAFKESVTFTIPQRHRQTDRQTTCLGNIAFR